MTTETGADPLSTAYEQGPWPAAQVLEPPPEVLQLIRRLTGRELSTEDLRTIARVSGFLGWVPIFPDARLLAARYQVADPEPPVHGDRPGRPRRRIVHADDLGDD